MIRSLVTQKAAPEAASGPAAFTIELGKPAVWGGAVGDVWVAKLYRYLLYNTAI